MSACALSDRRYIALLCSYTFSVLLLHRCVLFVFPLSLYHSQRTSTPRVCMSISVGNRIDGIFLFCIETHRSVLFVVTPSSCCPYNVQSERLLQLSACAFLGKASTRMPTVHSSKFCFHIVAVCLWSRRPCHVHRERLPHMSVCVCTSWAKLDENADDIYFSSVFIHIVAYCLWSRCRGNVHSQRLPHVSACSSFGPSNDYNDDPFTCLYHCRHMPGTSFTSACTTKSEVMLFLKSSL